MDTYYFGLGRFLGALDWYVTNVGDLDRLGVAMMNRGDLTGEGLLARFHAIDRSDANLVNIFMLPASEEFRELLLRWKSRCEGCGAQADLGCYDLSTPCASAGRSLVVRVVNNTHHHIIHNTVPRYSSHHHIYI